MISERRYLLTRCLRLEAEIVRLQHKMVATPRRKQRATTPDDRARMCDLRRQGIPASEISRQTGWHVSTVYAITKEKGK